MCLESQLGLFFPLKICFVSQVEPLLSGLKAHICIDVLVSGSCFRLILNLAKFRCYKGGKNNIMKLLYYRRVVGITLYG